MPDREVLIKRQQEMIAQIDEQYRSITDYRGVTFFETVPNGTRVWRFLGNETKLPQQIYQFRCERN